jgi:chromosome segregation ATPase
MWREINRLKEVIDKKANEGQMQCERISTLNHEIARVQSRCDDLNKMIECKTHELCAKQRNVDDTDRELMRTRDCNNKQAQDLAMLRRDGDRLAMENNEATKELKCTEARNSEFGL